jgi:hypothetical protein
MYPERRIPPRLALLALLLMVPIPSVAVLITYHLASGTTFGAVAYIVGKVLFFAFPAVWYLLVLRGKPSWSPIPRGDMRSGLAFGVLSGLFIVAVIGLVYLLVGDVLLVPEEIQAKAEETGIARLGVFVGFSLYVTLINSLLEEYAWRWFVFHQCESLMTRKTAVAVSALCFTAHHLLALFAQMPLLPTLLCGLGIFIGGAIWSWAYLRYRSIWPAYISHVFADAVIFIIAGRMILGP